MHAFVPPTWSQCMPQPPQLVAVLRLTSQPLAGLESQSPKPIGQLVLHAPQSAGQLEQVSPADGLQVPSPHDWPVAPS